MEYIYSPTSVANEIDSICCVVKAHHVHRGDDDDDDDELSIS